MTYFAVVLFVYVCDAALFTDVHWTTTTSLSEYVGYKSVSILSVNIPEQTTSVRYTFTKENTGDGCTFQDVHVCFQHGSYPLVHPYNETYPKEFYLNRTDAYHTSLTKPAYDSTIELSAPRPGTWYFAAFLPKTTSDKISVKFDTSTCKYGMSVVVESQRVDNIPEVDSSESHSVHLRQETNNSQIMYRYKLPYDTIQYEVVIGNCQTVLLADNEHVSDEMTYSEGFSSSTNTPGSPDTSSLSSTKETEPAISTSGPVVVTFSQCPVTVTISSEMLPTPVVKDRYNCSNSTNCQHTILSPTIGKWTYISIILDDSRNVSEVTFRLKFNIRACGPSTFMFFRTLAEAEHIQPLSSSSQMTTLPQDSCLLMESLGRLETTDDVFNVSFLIVSPEHLQGHRPLYNVTVFSSKVMVTSFDIEDHADIGGTFRLQSRFSDEQHILNNNDTYVAVYLCMMKNAIPGGSTIRSCDPGVGLLLNSSSSAAANVYIPYPEAGTWFIGITGHCINTKNGSRVPCAVSPLINLDIGVTGCIDGECGTYGTCKHFLSDSHVFSTCQCFADWRGYGCTDGKEGRTRNEELKAVLLLTLSNLFFLPAIVLSMYRGFYNEAFVYLFNMFFSAFYHACDTSDLVYYCLFKYDTLKYSDEFGSIVSFLITILAMANLRPGVRSFVDMIGVLCVAVGVMMDQNGPWKFLVPSGIAALVMIMSWIKQCLTRRSMFPPRQYFLRQFLPGILLASSGLMLFSIMETSENYMFTHSLWHVTISLSIVFLLPSHYWKETPETFKQTRTPNIGRTTQMTVEMDSVPLLHEL